jgi:hypothetical protein
LNYFDEPPQNKRVSYAYDGVLNPIANKSKTTVSKTEVLGQPQMTIFLTLREFA